MGDPMDAMYGDLGGGEVGHGVNGHASLGEPTDEVIPPEDLALLTEIAKKIKRTGTPLVKAETRPSVVISVDEPPTPDPDETITGHDAISRLTWEIVTKLGGFTKDHQGMAELFTLCFQHEVFWDREISRFMVYDREAGVWRQDGKKHEMTWKLVRVLSKRIEELCKANVDPADLRALSPGSGASKEEKGGARARIGEVWGWYKIFSGTGNHGGVVSSISPTVRTCHLTDFDRSPYLLNFTNGTYDVRTGQIREHRQGDVITHLVETPLNLSLADQPIETVAPLFSKMIRRMVSAPGEVSEEVAAERFAAVTRWLGYMVHGSNPEKKMGIFEGASNIGKNQVIGIVGELLGDQLAHMAARPQLIVKQRGDRHDSEESDLAGKRLLGIDELSANHIIDEVQILKLVQPEGSVYSLRRMKEDRVKVPVTWTPIASTNELPRARLTPQIVNRLMIFTMSKIQLPNDEVDVFLRHKIISAESEAILAHTISWWRDWFVSMSEDDVTSGLIYTSEMKSTMQTYREDNRELHEQFVEDCCEFDAEAFEPRLTTFWDSFQEYLSQKHQGEDLRYVIKNRAFNKFLESLEGVTIIRDEYKGKQRVRGLTGLRLTTLDQTSVMRGMTS